MVHTYMEYGKLEYVTGKTLAELNLLIQHPVEKYIYAVPGPKISTYTNHTQVIRNHGSCSILQLFHRTRSGSK